jgi:tetratricopeptide (TPR) repeat protein
MAKSAKDAVNAALKTLDEVKKPDGVADDAWATQTKTFRMTLNSIGAQASSVLKDYPAAIGFYKAYLALNPDEPITNYNLGRAYLALTPPQTMDGFWYVARGAASKNATQAQSKQLKDYLRKLVQNYQQATCENLVDAELNELLQLAAGSVDRPTSYNLPSGADLTNAQKDMTILSVINDLKAGGDKAKLTWLASCGSEFPGVPSKVIEIVPGDPLVLKLAFVTSDDEFNAATTPNMDLKVVGQPDAARVEKDSAIHFTGTLTSYDPDPAFMLHWEKGKVNQEDIPKEKAAPKKGVKKKPAAH